MAVDFSGRPYLVYHVTLPKVKIGEFDVELAREFFQAFANHCGLNLHINVMYGDNVHHIIEACFKAFARALDWPPSSTRGWGGHVDQRGFSVAV